MSAGYRPTLDDYYRAEGMLEDEPIPLSRHTMRVGGRYNWKHQPERLIYLGSNWSGNGYWHQFALVESPGVVWCEVLDSDLPSFEQTKDQPHD